MARRSSKLERLIGRVKSILPLWAPLGEAVLEASIGLFYSTLPLWLIPLITIVLVPHARPFGTQLFDNVKTGELFLYAAAALGPVLYVTSSRFFKRRLSEHSHLHQSVNLPGGRLAEILAGFLAVIIAATFAIIRPNDLVGVKAPLDEAATVWFSSFLFALTLLLLIRMSYSRNVITSNAATEMMRQDTEDFVRQFKDE